MAHVRAIKKRENVRRMPDYRDRITFSVTFYISLLVMEVSAVMWHSHDQQKWTST